MSKNSYNTDEQNNHYSNQGNPNNSAYHSNRGEK